MITNFSTSSIRTGIKRKRFWDQNAVANSYFSIATIDVGSGGAANIEFTNIPQTYTHLQIRGILRGATASNYVETRLRFNSDSGTNYANHQIGGDGATAYSDNEVTSVTSAYFSYIPAASSSASIFGVGIMDILDYRDTNKFKTTRTLAGNDRNGSGYALFRSSHWRSTSAITSILIYPSTGNFAQYSSLALYGVLA